MKSNAVIAWFVACAALLPHSVRAADERQILNLIASCLIEYAPENWQTFIVTVEEKLGADGKKQVEFEHQVVVGKPENSPQQLKPCLPLYIPGKLEELRQFLPPQSRGWVKATLIIQRDGRFKLDYKQPGT